MDESKAIMLEEANGIRYPSPFFDIASTFLPKNIKTMFQFCKTFGTLDGVIYPIINKLASYAITDLIFDCKNEATKSKIEGIFHRHLRILPFMREVMLDYFCFGNAFVSVYKPFIRYLECPKCATRTDIRDKDVFVKWDDYQFLGRCPKCKSEVIFRIKDISNAKEDKIQLLRWAPEDLDIKHNPISNDTLYFYTIPALVRKAIRMGDRDIIATTPWEFVEAVKLSDQKRIDCKIPKDQIFHLKQESISTHQSGWGIPRILAAMKKAYYTQVLRKANEAIAHRHIVPFYIVSPQASAGAGPPAERIDLQAWRGNLENEFRRWRNDPLRISIMPNPLQVTPIGGEGRSLLLTQEVKLAEQDIAMALGVPLEVVMGQMQWSAGSMAIRLLENDLMNIRADLINMFNYFIVPKVLDILNMSIEVTAEFKKLKIADDIAQQNILMQLGQSNAISRTTLLSEIGPYDYDKELKLKMKELEDDMKISKIMNKEQALIQTDAQPIIGQSQIEMQQMQVQAQQQMAMSQQQQGAPGAPNDYQQNAQQNAAKPMPEQLPPRRTT